MTIDEMLSPVHVDDPARHPSKAELLENLKALFEAALAHAGAFNSDDDLPDYSALAEEANLSLAEYEAVAMSIDGWSREEIAKFQHVSVDAVRSAYRRGLLKIRQYVLSSGAATFSGSVLKGLL